MANETFEGAIPVCDSSDIMHISILHSIYLEPLPKHWFTVENCIRLKLDSLQKKLLNRLFLHHAASIATQGSLSPQGRELKGLLHWSADCPTILNRLFTHCEPALKATPNESGCHTCNIIPPTERTSLKASWIESPFLGSRVIYPGLPRTWDPLMVSGTQTIPIPFPYL